MIAFLDANALIYLIEGGEPVADRARRQLQMPITGKPGLRIAISRLSQLECRDGLLKSGDAQTLADYDAFFVRPDILWMELTPTVVGLATVVRARYDLMTPDVLQAACCLQLGDVDGISKPDALPHSQ